MATIFPLSPQVNDEYNGYRWNGEAWKLIDVLNERSQDAIAAALTHSEHTNITVTYDDANNKIIFSGMQPLSQEQVQDFVAPLFVHDQHPNIEVLYDDETNKLILETIIPPSKAIMSATAPTTPADGEFWFDTDEFRSGSTKALKVWNALDAKWEYVSSDLSLDTTNVWTSKNTFDQGVIIALSSPPTNPVQGQIYYNTVLDKIKVYDGQLWQEVSGGGGGLSLVPTDLTLPPSSFFVGLIEPPAGARTEGDLWIDIDDDAGSTEFIYTGPEAPNNFGVDTLWIDTDEPELPLIYSDNEPPSLAAIEGDLWIDLDDTSGQSILSSVNPPSPNETEFWLDLTTEEGALSYTDLFKNGSGQIQTVAQLPDPLTYPGIVLYVVSEKSLYLSSNGLWEKVYPAQDAETLGWMGF